MLPNFCIMLVQQLAQSSKPSTSIPNLFFKIGFYLFQSCVQFPSSRKIFYTSHSLTLNLVILSSFRKYHFSEFSGCFLFDWGWDFLPRTTSAHGCSDGLDADRAMCFGFHSCIICLYSEQSDFG